jgi:hypothetical protein
LVSASWQRSPTSRRRYSADCASGGLRRVVSCGCVGVQALSAASRRVDLDRRSEGVPDRGRAGVGADVGCGSHPASSRGSSTGLAPPSGEALFSASSGERRLALELCWIDWALPLKGEGVVASLLAGAALAQGARNLKHPRDDLAILIGVEHVSHQLIWG